MITLKLFRSFKLPMRSLTQLSRQSPPALHARLSPRLAQPTSRTFYSKAPLRRQQYEPWGSRYNSRYQNVRPLLTSETFNSPGFRIAVAVGSGGAIIFYFANQETVPYSGRRRFNCYSAEAAETQGLQAFNQIMQQEAAQGTILPEWDPRVRQVKRVLSKLIEGGHLGSGSSQGSGWEVHVIEDPETQNAFVLPGGKVFVYSGILPICGGDDGLAAVLGHEIAHNIAQHTAERMSSAIPVTMLAYVFMYLDYAGLTMGLGQYLGSLALDLGVMKPAGRRQESEADYIGLLLMAQSCYDPRAAVGLWQRMEQAQQGATPEWLSTHPSNENRIARIQEWLPQAEEKSRDAACAVTTGYARGFKQAVAPLGETFWD